ncbi:PREDICTED: putative F-box protein At3g47150 [Camelina sativa]|uniref:F-box protein At3g47150 n=1 Tax=Camelina sativa TaxID=90675 RepID=A0ABM0ZFJ4_CAMSA|nr:PREDICTED: putative F-box protein At3g47150 [Camelina sativa]
MLKRVVAFVYSVLASPASMDPTPICIPLELQIEILLRLPVKSLLRFRCVSKLWSSIITSQDFQKRYLNIASSSSPRLLIAFEDFYGEKLTLVSSPNPNTSLSSSSSSCCVPYEDLSLRLNIKGKKVYNAGRGLICVGGFSNVGICNPSRRQLHTFPDFEFKNYPQVFPRPKYMFGYDPVGDQYKVLAVDDLPWRLEHKVIVLGGEEAWREAPCITCPHIIHTWGMYMNGTLYYGASMKDTDSPDSNSIIVSFDVRLETFNVINVPSRLIPMGFENMWVADKWAITVTDKTLINYRGKIGVVEKPRKGSFRMWVVEDAKKEEWSMNTFHLPQSAAGDDFNVMDTFYNGEVCLVPKELSDPFRLFFYNLDRKSMRSVTIEGLPMSELKRFSDISVTVSDYYESLKNMKFI